MRTIQAEDEIAAAGIALGAAFGGALGVTATSGPGMDLKAETIGLAVMLELPLVVIDVQRAGPSTGMPTKTEQSDLLMALYGRHGESPLPVVAAATPGDCFDAAFEAARIAVQYRTPVILLTRPLPRQLAPSRGGSRTSPTLPAIDPRFAPERRRRHRVPALRARRARRAAVGGARHARRRSTASAASRRPDRTGAISYDPANHARMTRAAARRKVAGIARARRSPSTRDEGAELLVLGWGSSCGAIRAARAARARARA